MSLHPDVAAITVFLASLACSSPGASDPNSDAGKTFAPFNLRSFESNAEGIGDACRVNDFAKAQAILGEAQMNWALLKPIIQSAGGSSSLVQRAEDGLGSVTMDLGGTPNKRACETDANTLSLAVADMFDLYSYPVPSDILRGDGVFRRLQVDGEYSDWTNAPADLTSAKAVWQRVRSAVAQQAALRPDIAGSATVVTDLDKTLSDCEMAIGAQAAAALTTQAQNGLDQIDTSETIFK